MVYEAIKNLENFSIIIPEPKKISEEIIIPPLSNKNFIVFLDDLNRFVDRGFEDTIDELKKKSKELIVIATCRTGKELNLVKEKMPSFYRKFQEVNLKEISENDAKKLTEYIKKEDKNFVWKEEQYDGTPGSVTLDLIDMKNRYENLKEGKVILRALKLLEEANIFPYKKDTVMDVCKKIFDLNIKKYEQDEIINNLKKDTFIKVKKDVFEIYPAYLDFCVPLLIDLENELKKLMEMFIERKDSMNLFYLGNGFYYKKNLINAEACYLEAIRINPNYAGAHNNLGILLGNLKRYEEAEKEYKEAIKINPNYADTHYNLGLLLQNLKHYEEAEKEYREAIKINPNYAGTYQNLSELYFVVKNYKKSLEYAEKSLEISKGIKEEVEEKVISKFLILINLIALESDYKKEKEDFLDFIRENKGYKLIWGFEAMKKNIKGEKFEEEIFNLIKEIEKFGVRK